MYHSPLEQVVLFDYRPSRSREGPTELLKNFKGYLQTDGYSVYESFGKNKDITLLGCMAHARRGFEKALEIDNNLIENAIRPVALGRKNYLFAGSHRTAQNAAMIYSFFATCKKHNVEPYAWLHYVLQVIQEYKVSKLTELLPQNFAKIHMP